MVDEARLVDEGCLVDETRLVDEVHLVDEAHLFDEASLVDEVRLVDEARLADETLQQLHAFRTGKHARERLVSWSSVHGLEEIASASKVQHAKASW